MIVVNMGIWKLRAILIAVAVVLIILWGMAHYKGSKIETRRTGSATLLSLAAEQEGQLDDQDDDHHQFEHEGAALVELVHHEAVEVFGGL